LNKVEGDTVNGKLSGVLAACGVMLIGSFALAQNPRPEKAKEKPLIDSIQGAALSNAYCASCHGGDAKGNGPMAKSLVVKPSDLTLIAARNGGTFPLARIERIISGEEQPPSGHGSSKMPVWGPIFSQVERDQDLGRVRIHNLAIHLRDIQVK
jgi:mono/diheme cytochrome c family protein